ncbi:F-box protein At3g07870-like [Mercurialis annua]|uniref:F-box protein At3g07870-like n=1 Tax=Mercurialis annua TaxID=3986 RepID=UPI002160DA98|nr:F-box protein At3g07870-like [Mercurialis annua]
MKQAISKFISDEVIENIFLKLPAESILRFRCISKYWHSVLSSPRFAASHRHLNPNQYCLALVEDDSINIVQYVGLQQNDPVAVFTKKLSFPPTQQIFPMSWRDNSSSRLFVYSGWKTDLFCSCNGILCIDMIGNLHNDETSVYMSDHVTVLWNPCTNAFRELPKSGGYPKAATDGILAYLGFVYDSSNNDYKVIKVERYFQDHLRSAIDLFSLKSNTWTSIADDIPYEICDEAIVINEGMYWLRRDNEALNLEMYRMFKMRGNLDFDEEENEAYLLRIKTREKLFRFDFTTKLIAEIPLPHMGENYNRDETQEFASLASDYLSLFTKNGDLWLLKDESWVKHMTIPPISGVNLMPLFLTEDNSIVTHAYDHAQRSRERPVQVTYDPQKSSFKLYKVHGIQHSSRVILYNQTLVSPSIFEIL